MFEQPFVTWLAVALQIPGRTARQCRDRWTNYLSPQNKNAPWTVEEDNLLAQKYLELGSQWTIIAKYFDGRSENNVKNRWYTHIKHKLENQSKKIENLPPEITPRIEVATRKIPSLSAKPRFVFPPISTLDSSIPDFTQMNVIQRTTSNKRYRSASAEPYISFSNFD
ncbi:Myb-like DNA-binding domain containing protein [Histomonas meleagridis]|uniref:Myb-like DNA-binding domain containing protein n=1 Tax=Histomonas meleagridis TaxID=135588 RepID=UPI00355A4088|nr:Myb-like DNA-binding domain containing protein [Histomonas meleagridis]KAH0796638.1 Myb-like DNA-binding domain containing protein [Histomonas meleagridis]